MNNRKKFAKVDRVRRLMNEDLKTLASADSSQAEKMHALGNQAARRRQKPHRSEDHRFNGMNNFIPPEGPKSRPSIQDETLVQPKNAHGYPTVPGAYQQFSGYNVQTGPRGVGHTGNVSNFGYDSEQSDRARALEYFQSVQSYGNMVAPASGPRSSIAEQNKRPENPVAFLERNLSARDLQYIGEVVSALVRQQEGQKLSKKVVFERYEQTNREYSQEQLFMIAHKMGLIQEKYESTAGRWVVTMPWANPQTPEQLLYNQKGFSQENYAQLEKMQQGNYYTHNDQVYFQKQAPQVPPATPQNQSGGVEYSARNNQGSESSLRNPKRGDDFIRANRLTLEELSMKIDLTQEDFGIIKEGINRLSEEIKSARREYNDGGASRKRLTNAEKKMKTVKNNLMSSNARRKDYDSMQNKNLADQKRVAKTASAVNKMASGSNYDGALEERAMHAYNRHLNLLSEASRFLSSNSGSTNYQGLNQNY